MEPRSRASPEQFAALLGFMETHGDIARPQPGPQGRITSDHLWQELRELLNSIGGGVKKSMDKWKKVWADWKVKTKKKALKIRQEACGTGGGPSSRQTLTALEQRVLGIMGLTAVIGQDGIQEIGFDEPQSQRDSLPARATNPAHLEDLSQAATDDIVLDFIPICSIEGNAASTATASLPSSSEVIRLATPQMRTPPPAAVPTPMPPVTSPNAASSREARQRRRRAGSPSPVVSPTASTPRRQRLLRVRTRRVQTPFQRAASEFVGVENRRLQFEEYRERNNHQREMEYLRLESRRIEMEDNRNQTLSRLATVLDNLTEILPRLGLSSLPSTDILP